MRAPLWSIGALVVVVTASALRAVGGDIAARDLRIDGTGLEVIDVEVATGIDIPVSVRTEFGGRRDDEAPFVEGLVATGELSGPGLAVPITLETAPGHPFRIPGLRNEGTYTLHDIRLVKDGAFLQPATPPVATITVANVLETSLRVRQLTAEELRARGITLDGRNWDAYGTPIPQNDLFETVSESLATPGAYGVGLPDPRILWRSDAPVASGTLAPLVDPRTGLVYAGRLLEKRLEVIGALDPRLRVLVDVGDGALGDTGDVPPGTSQNGATEVQR